ncbi:MAG: ABC transporter permease, partial [Nitrososphaerota archaeon]
MDLHKILREIAFYSTGITVAFVVAGLSLILMGHDILKGYYTLFFTSFSSLSGISLTILKFIPLLLMSLGFAIPLMARKYNVGVEGQFLLGAIGAVTVAFSLSSLPGPILITLILTGGVIFGAAWALIPALMLYKFNVNEIISTILLNFISFYLVDYIATGPWRDVFAGHPMTLPIPDQGILPLIIQNPQINMGFILALLFPFLAYLYVYRTVRGYELRAVGANPRASMIFGINTNYIAPLSLIIGGMLSGLAGSIEVAGLHYRLIEGMHSNYGSLSILIALICKGNPIGVILTSFFISVIEIGASGMQRTMGVPV